VKVKVKGKDKGTLHLM